MDRQKRDIADARSEERLAVPATLDFNAIPALSMELRHKLAKVRPQSIGHASRIEGMTPAAIACLIGAIRKHRASEAA
jgi:tRNA uridine 5-carboxymethylaminomethyl modification enzyme